MLLDLRFLWEGTGSTAISGTVTAQAIAQVSAAGAVHHAITGTAAARAIAQVNALQEFTGHHGSGGGGISRLPAENALLSLWAAGEISDDELEMLLMGRNKRRNKT